MKPLLRACALLLAASSLNGVARAQAPAPAPIADLIKQVAIPHDGFTLPNGLRVIVHTDRKAPVVALSIWYHVGSKDEPAGKTGFAHLFEHLMFYGSENAPEPLLGALEGIGATDLNGSTWFDRTNYFETVPTGALDRALFLESDRMGHLISAMTQAKLDTQRGVVQNEKRMNENEPGGLAEYAELDALFPAGHPYRHSTIGSMTDLNDASLADVKGWFRDHYGPNNAVLVLAGDIDLPTAKAKVAKWFGPIPRGPETARPDVAVPTLKAGVEKVMHDRVATVSISREWVVPGVNDPANDQLDLATFVLGGLGSSRLDNALVRKEKLAVSVSAGLQTFEKIAILEVNAKVRPGVDPAVVSKRMDEIVADYLKTGPTADELQRAATSLVAGRIRGLEQVGGFGGKAVTLAEGAVYSNDPDKYKQELAAIASATPASVTAAARTWMGRPSLHLTVLPGERSKEDQALAGNARHPAYLIAPAQGGAPAPAMPGTSGAPAPAMPEAQAAAALATPAPSPKIAPPPLLPIADIAFPAIERATLSNGIKVVFARRSTVPIVNVTLSFDAGNAADDHARLGTQALLLSLLEEGTTTLDSIAIAEAQERLGAVIGEGASMDRTTLSLSALKPNLAASMDIFTDIVRNPAFAPAEIERQRARLLARIATEETTPQSIATRRLFPMLYGSAHPYGVPTSGSGTAMGVRAVTRADLLDFRDRWLRPDNATIFAVGDIGLAELLPVLETRLGSWRPPATAKGVKAFTSAPAPRPRILLIDKPQSPQSMIIAGAVLPVRGLDDQIPLGVANDVLGGSTTSRLITDLRETKGWAYYAGTQLTGVRENTSFIVIAPVQTDKTGESIAAARADLAAYLGGDKGATKEELGTSVNGLALSLPGDFETSGALLGALMRLDTLGRPDDYYTKLPVRYRALTPAGIDRAARGAIDPAKLTWIVVGDAAQVRPQLAKLGLPIEDVIVNGGDK